MKIPRRTFIGLFVILATGYFAVVLSLNHTPPPFPALPQPNGYDDFVKAGTALAGDASDAYSMDHLALSSLIRSNIAVLNLVRTGLTRQCSAPTEAMVKDFTNVLSDLAALKRLAQLLSGEGRLAEMEGRTNDAMRSYIDCLAFGNEVSRGGLLINRLVGIAIEGIGRSAIIRLTPVLSCDQSTIVIKELLSLDTNAVTWNEIMTNENKFMRYQRQASLNPIRLAADWWTARSIAKGIKLKHDLNTARLRLLAIELALRCYTSETRHPPGRLADLVPKYLSRIPIDPLTGKELIYRLQGTNRLLYSVGEDGTDDGGVPITSRSLGAKGDVLFNVP